MNAYPAKLLLFGEHTVNAGSQALAVPLPLFSGNWSYALHLGPAELAVRQMQLPQLADYLHQLQQRGELLADLDVAAFKQALANGLVFESNIPTGYGAGSSGALVAAIFGNWKLGNWEIEDSRKKTGSGSLLELKKMLAQMEAFFHGTSSGTDPLICYLQKTVLLGGPKGVEVIEKSSGGQLAAAGYSLFLLDTGMPRQATPLIEYFLAKMQDDAFAERCRVELLPAVEAAIAAYLAEDGRRVFEEIHHIGGFQLQFLERMIPEQFRPIWQQGLDSDLFKLKVCGAGGGGFLLGITRDFEATKAALPDQKLIPVVDI